MTGFILEKLTAQGWRRCCEIYWRIIDAEHAASFEISRRRSKGVRILAVTVSSEAVRELEPIQCTKTTVEPTR